MRELEFERVDSIAIPFELLHEIVELGLCHTIVPQTYVFLVQVDTFGQYLG
jgi:hypothetical protein